MPKVDVGFVKDDDFPCQNGCTEFSGAEVVIVVGCLDNGETRQEAADVEPQVEFGGGFASPVLCPCYAVGHQLDGGGIHCVNDALETAWDSALALSWPAASERWRLLFVVGERFPEQLLGHGAVAHFVGV